MKTNYQKLTAYEAVVVGVALIGVALIGLQFYVALPEETKTDLVMALQVLDMKETWQVQLEVNEFVFGGVEEFYKEFYIASREIFEPVGEDMTRTVARIQNSVSSFAELGESLATNYQNNYAVSGVEDSVGGKVLGEYVEYLLE